VLPTRRAGGKDAAEADVIVSAIDKTATAKSCARMFCSPATFWSMLR